MTSPSPYVQAPVVGLPASVPAYLFDFTVSGSALMNGEVGFYLCNGADRDPDATQIALGQGDQYITDITDLIQAISSHLINNGFAGGTVSGLSVTRYTQVGLDVTPA